MRRLTGLCALLAFSLCSASAADPKKWRGTWAATDIGRSFQGSWTATVGDDPNVAPEPGWC